ARLRVELEHRAHAGLEVVVGHRPARVGDEVGVGADWPAEAVGLGLERLADGGGNQLRARWLAIAAELADGGLPLGGELGIRTGVRPVVDGVVAEAGLDLPRLDDDDPYAEVADLEVQALL